MRRYKIAILSAMLLVSLSIILYGVVSASMQPPSDERDKVNLLLRKWTDTHNRTGYNMRQREEEAIRLEKELAKCDRKIFKSCLCECLFKINGMFYYTLLRKYFPDDEEVIQAVIQATRYQIHRKDAHSAWIGLQFLKGKCPTELRAVLLAESYKVASTNDEKFRIMAHIKGLNCRVPEVFDVLEDFLAFSFVKVYEGYDTNPVDMFLWYWPGLGSRLVKHNPEDIKKKLKENKPYLYWDTQMKIMLVDAEAKAAAVPHKIWSELPAKIKSQWKTLSKKKRDEALNALKEEESRTEKLRISARKAEVSYEVWANMSVAIRSRWDEMSSRQKRQMYDQILRKMRDQIH